MKKFAQMMSMALVAVLLGTLAVGVAGAQDEVVFVLGVDQEPPLLSPLNSLVQGGALEPFYARNVWDWDTDRNIYPIMVEEIPSIENGMVTENEQGNTVVTYKLREGMRWSDGEPITSADCEFGHLLYTDPSTSANIGRADYANAVESFVVIDDLTFQLVYGQPYPDYAANEFASARCRYPNHVLRPILEAEGSLDSASYFTDGVGVVGYGPYRLVEWNKGQSIVFEKNEFWDGQEPAIDRLIIRYIFETAQMKNAMETGEIDLAYLIADPQLPEYEAIPGVVTWNVPAVLADAVWVNTAEPGHPALHDVRVREAIAHAMDRPAMAEGVIGPGTLVPLSWYPPSLWYEG
ncbi:MAG TPA: ABC transporter substrate-binding protein, partial [Spirillospora sp.]|nr:ABC transporter substrate-binding protein [Spirillospora sp.]